MKKQMTVNRHVSYANEVSNIRLFNFSNRTGNLESGPSMLSMWLNQRFYISEQRISYFISDGGTGGHPFKRKQK